MPEQRQPSPAGSGRARAVALSRLAAREGVACGGTDTSATLEALRGWLDATRAAGDGERADRAEADLVAILASEAASAPDAPDAPDAPREVESR